MSDFGMGVGMWVFWMVLILIVVFIVWALANKSSGQFDTGHEDAMDILRNRYARGEITKDEYESMKQELEK